MKKKMLADQIGGVIAILIGLISTIEAVRLYPLRMSTFVGDHTMPGLLGVILILLGIALIFHNVPFPVEIPDKSARNTMLGALVTILIYCLVIPYLGYLLGTGLTSIFLFRIFGLYKWRKCAWMGLSFTLSLYLIFILWLKMPFPAGLLNI